MSNRFKFWLNGAIILMLNSPNFALASRPYQLYQPPFVAQKVNVTASGARGCSSQKIDIKPLVPQDHVSQTISSHPTIFFYLASVPNSQAYFSLVDKNSPEPLYEKELIFKKKGIVPISIPETVTLKLDKEYVWNLEIICDRNSPAQNWYSRGALKRVLLPNKLAQELNSIDVSQKIEFLGKNGIWYDALSLSFQEKNNTKGTTYFNQLLQDIGLNIDVR